MYLMVLGSSVLYSVGECLVDDGILTTVFLLFSGEGPIMDEADVNLYGSSPVNQKTSGWCLQDKVLIERIVSVKPGYN